MITTQRKGGRRQCFGEICKKSKILLGNKKRSTHVRQAGWPGTKSNTGTKQDILTFKTHISRTTFAWFTVLPLGLMLWQCCIFVLINRNVAYHKNSKPKLLVRHLIPFEIFLKNTSGGCFRYRISKYLKLTLNQFNIAVQHFITTLSMYLRIYA